MRSPSTELPKQQRRVLDFIHANIGSGRFPTYSQIAAHMGWKNDASVRDCLVSLRIRGHLECDFDPINRRRLWRLA